MTILVTRQVDELFSQYSTTLSVANCSLHNLSYQVILDFWKNQSALCCMQNNDKRKRDSHLPLFECRTSFNRIFADPRGTSLFSANLLLTSNSKRLYGVTRLKVIIKFFYTNHSQCSVQLYHSDLWVLFIMIK